MQSSRVCNAAVRCIQSSYCVLLHQERCASEFSPNPDNSIECDDPRHISGSGQSCMGRYLSRAAYIPRASLAARFLADPHGTRGLARAGAVKGCALAPPARARDDEVEGSSRVVHECSKEGWTTAILYTFTGCCARAETPSQPTARRWPQGGDLPVGLCQLAHALQSRA